MILFQLIELGFNIYSFAIFVYVLMSWFPQSYDTPVGRFLDRICGPFLGFFDRFIPPIGGISFSPIIAIFGLQLIERGLIYLLAMILG